MSESPPQIPVPGSNLADLECAVCGDRADGQHFGADACRACAAFFRRTIAGKMKYVCRFENDCAINKTLRCMCRSCRLVKCMAVGMNPGAVQASRAPLIPPSARQQQAEATAAAASKKRILVSVTPEPVVKAARYSIDTSSASSTGSMSPVLCPKVEAGPYFDDVKPASSSYVYQGAHGQQNRHDLRAIVEMATTNYVIDQSTIPPDYPQLMTMLVAYRDFTDRRNTHFARNEPEFAEFTEPGKRTFIMKNVLNLVEFVQYNRTEVEWIAAMLSNFPGYNELPIDDRIVLFKNFWIHFVILERTFESFSIVDGPLDDNKMVLQNGDIFNVEDLTYDLSGCVDEKNLKQITKVCHPWLRTAGQSMLNPMKLLRPCEVEMIFAFGFMLWSIKDVSKDISQQAVDTAARMTNMLYDELFAYYHLHMPHDNFVRRISELMRLIGLTEKIVSHRQEDITITNVFNVFTLDVFLNELFHFVNGSNNAPRIEPLPAPAVVA
uniref:Nuclear receptor domain-containing protein n=1 Tax=Panagrellus redivivus TaxID=6233 RepID=A0A7E4V3U6_PANRE